MENGSEGNSREMVYYRLETNLRAKEHRYKRRVNNKTHKRTGHYHNRPGPWYISSVKNGDFRGWNDTWIEKYFRHKAGEPGLEDSKELLDFEETDYFIYNWDEVPCVCWECQRYYAV